MLDSIIEDVPFLMGEHTYCAWHVNLETSLVDHSMRSYLQEEHPRTGIINWGPVVLEAILATVSPVLDRLKEAGYDERNPAFQNPYHLFKFIEKKMSHKSLDEGRRYLRRYQTMRPDEFDNISQFLEALDKVDATLVFHGCTLSESTRIWLCLNAFEDIDPDWQRRVTEFEVKQAKNKKNEKKVLEKISWHLVRTWDDFARELILRCGELCLSSPVGESVDNPEANQKRTSEQQATEDQVAKRKRKGGRKKKKSIASKGVHSEAAEAAENAAETNTNFGKPCANNKLIMPSSSGYADRNTSVGDGHSSSGVAGNNRESTKVAYSANDPRTGENSVSITASPNNFEIISDASVTREIDDVGAVDDHEPLESDYACIKYHSDYGPNNDEEVADIVYIDGERRHRIPSDETRKRPRNALIDAPMHVRRTFFRSKFPGRPRCDDCACQHPVEAYEFCYYCLFCHVGGDKECYHLHPELRGTRPMKDKYRTSAAVDDTAADGGYWIPLGDHDSDFSEDVPAFITDQLLDPWTEAHFGRVAAECSRLASGVFRLETTDLERRRKAKESRLAEQAKKTESGEVEAKTRAENARAAEKLAPAPPPLAPATKTKPEDGSGARLSAPNLSRLNRRHRGWDSMSSLATSSSGDSIKSFYRQRAQQLKAAAAKKAALEASGNEGKDRTGVVIDDAIEVATDDFAQLALGKLVSSLGMGSDTRLDESGKRKNTRPKRAKKKYYGKKSKVSNTQE